MRVSMNILLDSISRYRFETGAGIGGDLSFRAVSLLPGNPGYLSADSLYICRLSEAIKAANSGARLFCICIRDRVKDELETAEVLGNLLIINENIKLEDLYYEVQDTFALVSSWCESMQYALIMHKSMQDILDMCEPIIGNFISISDSALALIAYTKNITTDDPISLFLIENGYHSEETVKQFRKFKRYDTWANSDDLIVNESREIAKHCVVSRVFSFNETYFTHVVMSCNHRELTPGLLDLFRLLTRFLGYHIRKDWDAEQSLGNAYSSLFRDLMSGKVSGRDRLNERARIVGIKPDTEYAIMLLAEGRQGNASFPEHMAQDISKIFPCVSTVYYNLRLVLFLYSNNLRQALEEEDILERLNGYFEENDIFGSISDYFDDLLELPAAYLQADMTLSRSLADIGADIEEADRRFGEMREMREVREGSNIAHFCDYFISCFLDSSEQAQRIWKNSSYGKLLLKLHDLDLEKHTNYLETLYTYLLHERRASDAAIVLHMHRNNVVYRINRIEEMLGLSLSDAATRMNILMSFMLLREFGFDIWDLATRNANIKQDTSSR